MIRAVSDLFTHLSSWMACALMQRPGALARPNDVSPRRRAGRSCLVSSFSGSSLGCHPGNRVRSVYGLHSGQAKKRSNTLRQTSILCCGRLVGVLVVCCYGLLGYGITDRVTISAVRDVHSTMAIFPVQLLLLTGASIVLTTIFAICPYIYILEIKNIILSILYIYSAWNLRSVNKAS